MIQAFNLFSFIDFLINISYTKNSINIEGVEMENNENKTPVTENKEEVKNTTVEENKEKPAKKKSLFTKEKKPWEEEKDKIQLDNKDYLCITGFIILLIIALVPYFIRILDPMYDDTKKFSLKGDDSSSNINTGPKSKKKLSCNKSGTAEGYSYTMDIVNTYEDGTVKTNNITYTIVNLTNPTLTNDTVSIDEYKTISEISSPGIKATHETGTTTYNIAINYDTDQALRTNATLSGHFKTFGLQKGDYEEKGFVCQEEKLEG